MVQFQNVSKIYTNGFAAVKGIDFIINEGEFVFLIGPSGSGKTTLIELLIRDQKITDGKIYFNDIDITNLSRKKVYQLRRQIGVIFQDFKLVPEKTAYENVAFAMEAAGRKNKEIKETVPYVLDIVGLGDKLNYFPKQLSGGEQQRVAIARAIANNPKMLIADEPTGNLDPASAWDIVQILTKINNWGTTVIMSTHGTDIVNSLNKRVIQMEKGLVVRDDSEGQYEFSENVIGEAKSIKKKSKEVGKSSERKSKTTFKFDLNKHLDTKISKKDLMAEDELEGMEILKKQFEPPQSDADRARKKRGLFGWLFRKKLSKDKIDDSIISNETLQKKMLEEIDELDYENEVDNEEDQESKTKKKNKKEKSEKSSGLHINLNSGNEVESEKDLIGKSLDIEDEVLEKVISKHMRTPVDFLNVPKKIVDDLKKSGYKTLGEIISDGPEKLSSKLKIDPEEVLLVARALEKVIERTVQQNT
jgi:cell division transport system ATP-binding protein